MTLARRQLELALDQQATAQVQVDMAVEDLQAARRTGDERKIREAKEEVKEAKEEVKEAKEEVKEAEQKVEKAEEKVQKAEEKVEKAEEKVKEAKEEVQKVQEKAICCTASVWSQFFQKMQK